MARLLHDGKPPNKAPLRGIFDVHRTSVGVRPRFRGSGPNGGFGVWWLCPPGPALAGNASRWAAYVKSIYKLSQKQGVTLPKDIGTM